MTTKAELIISLNNHLDEIIVNLDLTLTELCGMNLDDTDKLYFLPDKLKTIQTKLKNLNTISEIF